MTWPVVNLPSRQWQVWQVVQTDPTATLQEIADKVGVSRERVRQICVLLKEIGALEDRKELKKAAVEREKQQKIEGREYRKKIWRRMMFIGMRQRYRFMARIDHRGLVQDYHMPGQETICQFSGCTKSVRARGFCALHYSRLRWSGALWVRRQSRSICIKEDCAFPVYARNLCHNHYTQYIRKHPSGSGLRVNNTSGYRGVSANGKYWQAYIYISGDKQKSLGMFESKEMAARAYDTAARKHFGEKAKLNFPNENIEVVGGHIGRNGPRNRPVGVSGYRGVQWDKSRQRWRVQIERDGKYVYNGSFLDVETAVRAYDSAAIKLFGDKAILNFPDNAS